jgi:hypothetical protein
VLPSAPAHAAFRISACGNVTPRTAAAGHPQLRAFSVKLGKQQRMWSNGTQSPPPPLYTHIRVKLALYNAGVGAVNLFRYHQYKSNKTTRPENKKK